MRADDRPLKLYLQCQLPDSWVPRALNQAESEIISNLAIRVIELRMVKGIEELGADLQRHPFFQPYVLQQANVPIVEAWPVEEPSIGTSQLAERFDAKKRRVKVGKA